MKTIADLCINQTIQYGEEKEGKDVHEDQIEPSYINLDVLLVLPEIRLLSFDSHTWTKSARPEIGRHQICVICGIPCRVRHLPESWKVVP